jgi:hypothetical protein
MARGKNESPVGVVSSIRIPPKTWVHIAVARNKETLQIFVGGLLAGEVKHNTTPTNLTKENSLKIGYAGNGFSSAILRVDEITIFSNTPTLEHWLCEAVQRHPNSFVHGDPLKIASESFVRRDYDKALTLHKDLCQRCTEHKQIHSTLMYRVGEIHKLLNQLDRAKEAFEAIANDTEVSTAIRSLALHDFLCLQEGVDAVSDTYAINTSNATYLDYGILQAASERYRNAILEYDFAMPLKQEQILK